MKKSKMNIIVKLLILIFVLLTTLSACSLEIFTEKSNVHSTNASDISLHFLDVGQGDSIFVELPNGECMLIDAGVADKGEFIESYITEYGYDKIDYLIATHPHADHIGSMAYVVSNMDIGQVYMPNVSTTTKTFEKLLNAIQKKGLKIKSAKAGMNIVEDSDLSVDILAPVKIDEDKLNNCSVIIKITYGNDSYLLTGDAEKEELETVWADMSSDVLKAGHHGSRTSTTEKFLEQVNPKYAVISCGEDNDYGHPHIETLKLFDSFDVEYYRTDTQGTITVSSDGTRNYIVKKEK